MRSLLAAIILALPACAASVEGESPAPIYVDSDTPAPSAPAVSAPSEPTLRLADVNLPGGVLEAAVERWRAATGLRIDVGAGGVPVEIVSDAFTPAGQVCAVTESNAGGPLSVRIDATPPSGHGCRADAALALAHEIGHAICRFYAPIDGDCHVAEGLMGHRAELGSIINAATLEKVCEFAPCTHFTPERE